MPTMNLRIKTMFSLCKKLPVIRNKAQILLVLVLLSACDGGGLQLANGVGGTGITVGRLTGFGSMYVNGIKFNTDAATFIRDGVGSKSQGDFSTGEIVKINGTIDSNKITGTANEVIFTDLLEGVVTKVASGKTFEVLGQAIRTDNLTVLHGFNKLSDLKLDNVLEVSGFSINNEILASSLKLISEDYVAGSTLELEGLISNLNKSTQTFSINNINIDYSLAEFMGVNAMDISNEQYVIVSAEENINNGTLSAVLVTLNDDELEANADYEIEGFVTQFVSSTSFELDGFPIISSASTTYRNGAAADISMDSHLIITGTVNNQGDLVAQNINILNADTDVLLEATIESIDLPNQMIMLLGQTVNINSFTLISDEAVENNHSIALADFSIGDSVYVSGREVEGDFLADRLSKISPISMSYLSGGASSIDRNLQELTLFGLQVMSDGSTVYFDKDFNEVTQAAFFDLIEENETLLTVEGSGVSGGFSATTIGIVVEE